MVKRGFHTMASLHGLSTVIIRDLSENHGTMVNLMPGYGLLLVFIGRHHFPKLKTTNPSEVLVLSI